METPRYITRLDLVRAARTDDARYWIERAHSADLERALDAARDGLLPLHLCAEIAATEAELSALQHAGERRTAHYEATQARFVYLKDVLATATRRALNLAEGRPVDGIEPVVIRPRLDRAPMPGAGSRREVKTGSDLHAVLSGYVAGGEAERYAYASLVLEYPVVSFGALTPDEREAVADAAREGRFLTVEA